MAFSIRIGYPDPSTQQLGIQEPVAQRCPIDEIRVLIADDSLPIRERLVTMLDELQGIGVVGQAGTVPETISAIRELKPDVVTLDIRMPGGSGLDVLHRIKQGQAAPLVIILTNYAHPPFRQRFLEAGADFFFDKSVEFDQITRVLTQLKARADSGQVP
jgi:DNA-binding NarL/FixJ family response regulator